MAKKEHTDSSSGVFLGKVYSEEDLKKAEAAGYQRALSEIKPPKKETEQPSQELRKSAPSKTELELLQKAEKAKLEKAVDEAYALGFKHGRAGAAPPSSRPDLMSHVAFEALHKTMQDNARVINSKLLENNRKTVAQHMKAWREDANKALDEVLAAGEHHKKHDHATALKKSCDHDHED
jgi:hypothetical protein